MELAGCERVEDGRVVHGDDDDGEQRNLHPRLEVGDVAVRGDGEDEAGDNVWP